MLEETIRKAAILRKQSHELDVERDAELLDAIVAMHSRLIAWSKWADAIEHETYHDGSNYRDDYWEQIEAIIKHRPDKEK